MSMSVPRRSRAAALIVVAALPLAGLATTPTPVNGAPATSYFERTATYPVYLNRPAGTPVATPTVAEISAVTPDGQTLVYTDALARRMGFLDITDPGNPVGTGTVSLAALGDATDEPTSVAVVGEFLVVVVNTSESFTNPSGRADVIRLSDRSLVSSVDLGGQPDSIAISKDGRYAAVAIENERDESVNGAALPQLPAGFLQVLDLAGPPTGWTATPVRLTAADGSALPAFAAAGLDTPQDPEPEYVSINDAGQIAVTLQENNGVVVVDAATRTIETVFSAGRVTLTGVDATRDQVFNPVDTITRVREPDAIAWVGPDLVATANEGDWKGGSRGWTVFRASTGEVVWDAGITFEQLAARHGHAINSRAASKGTEPEGLSFATMGGTPYAFVGSERSNVVAVYDMSEPTAPRFHQLLPTTNGPEGILPIPGSDLLAVSSETDDASALVRASVSLFRLGAPAPFYPSIVSADQPGVTPARPIGWGALGSLTGSPTSASTLYAASDSAFRPARIYTVDTARTPATITGVTQVTDGTGPLNLDVEGLAARPDGGFWLASEGATGPANRLYRVDAGGVVQETVDLPAEVTSRVRNWGLEGITVSRAAGNETLYVALQRPLWTSTTDALVPAEGNVTRIGRYDTVTRQWSWFTYPLARTSTAGDWIGVSEVVAVDADTLAVLERDKLNGPDARIKRVYTVDLPDTGGTNAAPTPLTKTLVRNLLPDLRATNGWTQEKVEGLTVAADGRAYAVTDNDGLTDATGETVFLRLGDLFGLAAPAPTPTTPTAPTVPAVPAAPTPAGTASAVPGAATRTTLTASTRAVAGRRLTVRVRVAGAADGRVRLVTSTGVRRTLTLREGRARTRLTPGRPGVLSLVASYVGSDTAASSVSRIQTVRVRRSR